MASWKEVLKRKGVDFDALARKQLKEEAGCVILGLQSITGALATEGEWDMRLDEIRQTGATSPRQEFRKLKKLVETLADQPTLLGIRLAAMEVSAEELFLADARGYIKDGNHVLAALPLQESDGKTVWHAAHLVEGTNGALVDATDPDFFQLTNEVRQPFNALVFTRK